MGLLRILLAVAVVGGHTQGHTLVGGRVAVELFYVVSGFLISYIFIERRAYPSVRAFWTSRFLRLYPAYIVVAIGSLGIAVVLWATGHSSPVIETFQAAPPGPRAFLGFTNATLFFQDATMFMGVDHGNWVFATDFRDSSPPLWQGLLVPPAWSLGVEMAFYAIAPWVLRSRVAIGALIVTSVALRLILVHGGLGSSDPWTYRFFPTELVFFLLGVIAHQYIRPMWKRLSPNTLAVLAKVAVALLASVFVVFLTAPGPFTVRGLGTLALFVVALPLAFEFRAWGKWDRLIGELSYPLYLCHYPIIQALVVILAPLGVTRRTPVFFAVTLVVSLALSVVLVKWVAQPFDRRRHRLRNVPVTGA